MTASPSEVVALYDEYGARLYALALRITSDERAAAAVLEEVFTSPPVPSDLAGLVRVVRESALRNIRSPAPSVEPSGMKPVPRAVVEEAFYNGRSVAELAAAYSLPEATVRAMLHDGMSELRDAVAARK